MTTTQRGHRVVERVSAGLARIVVRGQLGSFRETELARLSGARR